jgi:hypothetical protein
MGLMHVIREYHEIIYIEDAFAVCQKARLNIYRLNEIEDYVNTKGYFTEVGWKYWKSKINLRRKQFDQLESRMGINTVKPINSVSRGYSQNTLELKELITIINAYLILNYKIEKTVLSIQRFLLTLLKMKHKQVSGILEQFYDGYARYLREIKINNLDIKLNQVTTDDDKLITYEIQSKVPKFKKTLNTFTQEQLMCKIKDNESLILKEYKELDRYEKLLSTVISNNMDIIDKLEKEKNENFNTKGNLFNWGLAALAFLFVIYSAITDTISILQNEGYTLIQIGKIIFYLLKIALFP